MVAAHHLLIQGDPMPASYWKLCYPGSDGEEICTELHDELPPALDEPVQAEVALLAGLNGLAHRTTNASLRIGLLEALDAAAVRLNTRLSGGTVLRRSDLPVRKDDPGFVGVPLVIGMTLEENAESNPHSERY